MKIRPSRESDVQAVARLWHLGWHLAHSGIVSSDLVGQRTPDEFVERAYAHLGETHVANINGSLAGFFMVKGTELYQFYLDPVHHGSGAATLLMEAAEAHLAGPRAWLGCTVGNDRAAAFYKKAGWANMGEEVFLAETSVGTSPVTIWRFEKDL